MRFSLLVSILALSPAYFASNNDKRDVKIIKVTKTVDTTITNTHVVDAPTSTLTNWSTLTSTTTTTRYTSTFTSTIFGNVYTYLSVFNSIKTTTEPEATQASMDATSAANEEIDVTSILADSIKTTTEPEATQASMDATSAANEEIDVTSILADSIKTTTEPEATQASMDATSAANEETDVSSTLVILDPVTTPIVSAPTTASTTSKTIGIDSIVNPSEELETLYPSTTTISTTENAVFLSPTTYPGTDTSTVDGTFISAYKSQTTSIPLVWDGYTLEDSLTNVVSGLICMVDLIYYSDTETITSTSVVYQTVSI